MNNNLSQFNICQINCSGLSDQSRIALDRFSSEEGIHALAIQETGNLGVCHTPQLHGKTMFLNHVSHGVCLAVDNSLIPQSVPELASPTVEAVWAISRIDSQSVLLGSMYSPPSIRSLKSVLQMINKAWCYCKDNNIDGMLCMGDFNARSPSWGDHSQNLKGRELLHFIQDHNDLFLHSPGTQTFVSKNPSGYSVIDLAISAGTIANKLYNSHVNEAIELFTGAPARGHFPVIHSLTTCKLKVTESTRRDLFNCDWDKWKLELDLRVLSYQDHWESLTAEELWVRFLHDITQTNERCIPTKRISSHSKPFWSATLSAASLTVRAARTSYQARSTPSNKSTYDLTKKEFGQLLVKEKNDWIHKRLEGLNASESTEFWTKYKYVFGAPKDNLIGNLRNGGDLISEEAEKEALLFDTFFTGRHLNNLDFDEEHYTKINTELPQKLLAEMENEDKDSYLNGEIDLADIKIAINKQKSGSKATDTYGIHPVMMKNFGYHVIRLLGILFNKVLDTGVWPWTDSMTSFIKKDGKSDYTKPGAYRPICISSYVGKLLERILEKRLVTFSLKEEIIDECQEGFLPKRNTSRYLYRMISSLHEVKRKKMTAMLLLIDFEKAYDSVPVKCLISKLHDVGVGGKILRLLFIFLSSRTTKLKVNNFIGQVRVLILIGLPQGAVLAPILFIIYIADLLDHRRLPEELRKRAQAFKFADDGSVAVVGVNILDCWAVMKGICTHISNWCKLWRLSVNCEPDKTEIIGLFCSEEAMEFLPSIVISSKPIRYVKKSKVLGLVNDYNLSFTSHAQLKLRDCWLAWSNLCRHTTRIAGLNSSSLAILFKCIVLTKLLYASPVWIDKNLDVYKDLFARMRLKISGSEFHLPKTTAGMLINIPPLDILVTSCTVRFLLKCLTSQDQMTGLILQIESSPGHLFYSHIAKIRQFLKWNTKSATAQRSIDIITVDRKHCLYNKEIMSKFVGFIWDLQLNCDSSRLIKDREITTSMSTTILEPFLLRTETRQDQAHWLDFLHGRSARFMNFRRSVKLCTSSVCLDCSEHIDSNVHKLFTCSNFNGSERDEFVELLGGEVDRFEELVLFSGKEGMDLRKAFKRLVRFICDVGHEYDYRVELNR